MRANPVVVLCGDQQHFIGEANNWAPGNPFPVLAGPSLDRYRALFPGGKLPAPGLLSRPGAVVSVGGPFSRAAGRLLAAATSRAHHHLPVAGLFDWLADRAGECVAVVGLADEVSTLEDWPGRTGALVGLLVTRDEQALASLVYRSVTPDAMAEDRVYVASHPLLDGAVDADAASLTELAESGLRRPRLLVLRGQGRECCISLLDGMICGRSDRPGATPATPPAGYRATPCMQGHGCFRTDLGESDLMRAHDVNAVIVFTHSCSAIALGTNAYPLDLSVSLGILEGTAVAVVGAMGVHVLQPSAQRDLEAQLADGLPLGVVVARVEELSQPLSGELNRFGLLGDPGLTLAWHPRPSQRSAVVGLEPDDAVMAALTEYDQVILPRLERMRWLYLEVPDADLLAVRKRLREIFARPAGPEARSAVDAVGASLAALQYQMVESLVARIYSPGWDPSWIAGGFRQVSARPTRCPSCRRPIAVRLLLRHRVEPELSLQTVQCRRCGDIFWTTEAGEPGVTIEGPVEVNASRDRVTYVDRVVVNHRGDVLRGGIGYSFRARKNLGLPPGRSEACEVPPYTRHQFQAVADLRDSDAPLDTHTMPVVAVLNGVFVSSMVMMHLT